MKRFNRFSIMSFVMILIITAVLFSGCSGSQETFEATSKTTLQFGTIIQITIFDPEKKSGLNRAIDHMKTLEDTLSTSIENSDVNTFNNADANMPITLGEHSKSVIERGLYYSEFSDGCFDITIEPIVDIWGIGKERAGIPEKDTIEALLNNVDYNYLSYDGSAGTLTKLKDDISIDLGAIAKGYAADEAARILREEGVDKALINLGGNVYALGNKTDSQPWNVGIQDPLEPQGAMIGIVQVSDQAVITSGIYERFFEEDGVRYHHILDPKTGYPLNNELLGVSIITPSAIDGDALSTVVYTKGLDEGMELIESLENTEAIFITRDKKIYVSTGADKIFEKRNENYDLISAATRDSN